MEDKMPYYAKDLREIKQNERIMSYRNYDKPHRLGAMSGFRKRCPTIRPKPIIVLDFKF